MGGTTATPLLSTTKPSGTRTPAQSSVAVASPTATRPPAVHETSVRLGGGTTTGAVLSTTVTEVVLAVETFPSASSAVHTMSRVPGGKTKVLRSTSLPST